ncbi:relA-associated inhibitor-like, partial [Hirundo rustica]|uniref:relA-associated inhibitor-like n=1 Tax=Hirundo rustica TaxID=43150 RepID=UPI0026738458
MASERLRSAQDLLDLTFQSLAMQHMDLKQVELDTAVAKVDELSRQLESLWTDGPGPPPQKPPPHGAPPRPYEFLGGLGGSPRAGEGPGGAFLAERPPAPPPYEVQGLYPSLSGAPGTFWAQDDLGVKRRPHKSWNESDLDVAYEKKPPGSGGYERTPEGQARPPLGLWRESSLDGAGPGKDGAFAPHSATLPRNYKLSPLERERRQDGGAPAAIFRSPPAARTLPRGWQPVSRIPVPPPAAGRPPRHKPLPLSMIFRLQKAFWEQGGAGLAPRGFQPLLAPQGGGGRGSPQKLPAVGVGPPGMGGGEAPLRPALPEPPAPTPPETEAELERLLRGSDAEAAAEGPPEGPPECPPEGPPARPLSPTRLQPLLPPEARRVPEFQEVARVLAEMPRPLKRRGSMEQSPGPAAAPSRARQYRQLITRLLHRPPAPGDGSAEVALSLSPPPAAAAAPAVESSALVAPAVAAAAVPVSGGGGDGAGGGWGREVSNGVVVPWRPPRCRTVSLSPGDPPGHCPLEIPEVSLSHGDPLVIVPWRSPRCRCPLEIPEVSHGVIVPWRPSGHCPLEIPEVSFSPGDPPGHCPLEVPEVSHSVIVPGRSPGHCPLEIPEVSHGFIVPWRPSGHCPLEIPEMSHGVVVPWRSPWSLSPGDPLVIVLWRSPRCHCPLEIPEMVHSVVVPGRSPGHCPLEIPLVIVPRGHPRGAVPGVRGGVPRVRVLSPVSPELSPLRQELRSALRDPSSPWGCPGVMSPMSGVVSPMSLVSPELSPLQQELRSALRDPSSPRGCPGVVSPMSGMVSPMSGVVSPMSGVLSPVSPVSPEPSPLRQELRSALRDPSCPRRRPGARVRLNPLVLLLDAALTGELDVVQQAVAE